MSTYAPDPGGVFPSDVHRRVLGHLPVPGEDPTTIEDLAVRLAPDGASPFAPGDEEELGAVLNDLDSDGHASKSKAGWRMTKAGFTALTGPNAGEES